MCIPVGRSQGQESNTIGAPAARAVISAEVKGEGKQPAGLESNFFYLLHQDQGMDRTRRTAL